MMESKSPGNILTVILRDNSPMIYAGDSPKYRSVQIALTESQRDALALRWTGESGVDMFEEVSKCFIEEG